CGLDCDDIFPSGWSDVGVEDDRYPANPGSGLFEQLQPFAPDRRLRTAEASNVSFRAGDVLDQASGGWVTAASEDDWDALRLPLRCARRCGPSSDNHIRCQRYKLRRRTLHPILISSANATLNLQVTTFDPPEVGQPPEGARGDCPFVIAVKPPNQPHAAVLLRPRRERPRGCGAAERSYHFPPSDSDRHVALPCEGWLVKASISRRKRAVFTLGDGEM